VKSIDQIARDVVSQYNAIPEKSNELYFLKDIPHEIKDIFRKEFHGQIDQESLLVYIDTTYAMFSSHKYGALLTNRAVYFFQKDKKSVVPLEEIKNIYLGKRQLIINDEEQLYVATTAEPTVFFYNILCHIFRYSFGDPVKCPIDLGIFFPKSCIGCGATDLLEQFEIPVYGNLRNTAEGNLVQKYALGSALLGGIVFSVLLGDLSESLKKREIKNRYQIPICSNCLKTLNKFETDTFSQPLISDDSINATIFGNRLFWIQATPRNLSFWIKRSEFASSFQERNCNSFNARDEPSNLPSDLFIEYQEVFGNSVTETDAKIIHEWRLNFEPISEKEPEWFFTSELPQKKIDDARLKYPEIQPNELLIALKESNFLGSKSALIVVTTKGVCWGYNKSKKQLKFAEIPPESIILKKGFPADKLLYGDGLEFPIILFSSSGNRDHQSIFVNFLKNACQIAEG